MVRTLSYTVRVPSRLDLSQNGKPKSRGDGESGGGQRGLDLGSGRLICEPWDMDLREDLLPVKLRVEA